MRNYLFGYYLAILLSVTKVARAANTALVVYDDRASFQAAVGSAPMLTQTFDTNHLSISISLLSNQLLLSWEGPGVLEEGPTSAGPWTTSLDQSNPQARAVFDAQYFRVRSDLRGRELLPGVYVTSPFVTLGLWPDSSNGGFFVFGFDDTTRMAGLGYYELELKAEYNAVAFDVAAWDPEAPGPAVVEVLFADSTSAFLNRYQTSGDEGVPVFFGISSNKTIKRIRWNETPEVDGTENEEVGLDSIAVAFIPAR